MEVPCIRCGEVNVWADVVNPHKLCCNSCNEEYTASDVESIVEGWTRILPWLKSHPGYSASE